MPTAATHQAQFLCVESEKEGHRSHLLANVSQLFARQVAVLVLIICIEYNYRTRGVTLAGKGQSGFQTNTASQHHATNTQACSWVGLSRGHSGPHMPHERRCGCFHLVGTGVWGRVSSTERLRHGEDSSEICLATSHHRRRRQRGAGRRTLARSRSAWR